MGKTALIVDDSKSARFVLKRMLETHELEVDTAGSAEDALDYLNDNRPDVIFMDHLMPGMDGFEAVSAIKNNPDTATIPIMMYTSQKGELYVGQARALGAVGVLPKQVEPVEVSKVLESLRVIGADRDQQINAPAPGETGELPNLEQFDQDLQLLIQDLFEQQRAILRRDLLDSYEMIAQRVADEIRSPAEVSTDVDAEAGPEMPLRMKIAVAVLGIIAMVFAILYAQREQSWLELQQRNAELTQALDRQLAAESSGSLLLRQQLMEMQQSMDSALASTLRALEWGANRSAQYGFGELPLGDQRLVLLEDLSERLLQAGFSGTVRIETHVGNFCMADAGADGLLLAGRSLPAEQCTQVGFEAGTAYEMGLRQSVAFANFVRAANGQSSSLANGRVRFEIVSLGSGSPLIAYPPGVTGLTAGAWNDIAAANNRVQVSMLPDSGL